MAIDGGYLHNLVRELSDKVVGTRVDKVFVPSSEETVLLLRSVGFSGRLIISARNGAARVNFTENAPENPKSAPMFCMLLRKYIGGSKITEISQPNLERVFKIGFEARNELGDLIYPSIYVEMITGNSNIIFTDTFGRIIDCIRKSDIEKNTRMLQPGAKYTLPAGQDKLNILESTVADAVNAVSKLADRRLCDAILTAIDGISPLISREIAFMCSPNMDAVVSEIGEKQLKWALEKLKQYLSSGEPYILYKEDGTPFDFSYMPIRQYGNNMSQQKAESFSALLDGFYTKRDNAERMRHQSQDILKLLTTLSNRTARKINARKADLKKCENKDKFRIYGELIKANMYAISRGDSHAEVINYYDESGGTVKIPLNVALSPADNAQKYFKDYKKLCVAEKTLSDLIDDSERELVYLDSIFEALSRAETSADLLSIRDELSAEGYIKGASSKKKNSPSKPLQFTTTDGFSVLVGKNNLQNDELTLRLASKDDIWLHTKNVHGSHVILRCGGKEPTDTAVTEAAILAAYHSKARNSSSVAVDYTPVKFVKKPAGARPGMVIYTKNKTAYVTPNEEIVARLKG